MVKKVLIAAPVHAVLKNGLTDAGYELIISEKINQQEAHTLVRECEGIVTSTRLLLDKDLIDATPQLKWIGRMGSGMEIIDVAYATEKGIRCFSSPDGNSNAVGEHATGLLLSLTRRIVWSNNEVAAGQWLREENRGVELEGRTIGIIGFGHTGRAFAKKLRGFDMRILAHDADDTIGYPEYVQKADLADILNEAKIISFHLPLNPATGGYLNTEFVEQMQHPFLLINTSRGEIVATEAVLQGLESGKIIAAGFDVLEGEPLSAMNEMQRSLIDKWIGKQKIVVTPHIAGYTHEALFKMSESLLRKIVTAS